MGNTDDKPKHRNAHAAELLRRLDEIGAINLGVLVSKSAEIQGIAGGTSGTISEVEHDICYPFVMQVGPHPPREIDLVSVVNQLRDLGFEVRPLNLKQVGAQTKV
jgi:hypothetical protein